MKKIFKIIGSLTLIFACDQDRASTKKGGHTGNSLAGERIYKTAINCQRGDVEINSVNYDKENLPDMIIAMLLTYSNIKENHFAKKPSYQNSLFYKKTYQLISNPSQNVEYLFAEKGDKFNMNKRITLKGKLSKKIDGLTNENGEIDCEIMKLMNNFTIIDPNTGKKYKNYENVVLFKDIEEHIPNQVFIGKLRNIFTNGNYEKASMISTKLTDSHEVNYHSHFETDPSTGKSKESGHAFVEIINNKISHLINSNNAIKTSTGRTLQANNCELLANLMVCTVLTKLIGNFTNISNSLCTIDQPKPDYKSNFDALSISGNKEEISEEFEREMRIFMIQTFLALGILKIETKNIDNGGIIKNKTNLLPKDENAKNLLLKSMQEYDPNIFLKEDKDYDINNFPVKDEKIKVPLKDRDHTHYFYDITVENFIEFLNDQNNPQDKFRVLFTVFQIVAVYLTKNHISIDLLDIQFFNKEQYSDIKFFVDGKGTGVPIG